MNAVLITDAAIVTGLGDTLDTTWQRLLRGESALRPLDRFDATRYLTTVAATIDGLTGSAGGSRLYPLMERLLDGFGPVPADCRLITATTKGCIDTMERLESGLGGNPADVPAASLLASLRQRYGLTDPGYNVNVACASSTVAVARAASLIASGRSEAVLVVCMDLVSEFVFSGFSALQGLSPEPCRPFDRQRNGLSLGEGGAALLLMSEGRARREGRLTLATLLGWGAANDATHITAPARDGCGLVQATRQALAAAHLAPEEIAGISAHGTGTVYNDAMELTAFRQVFGDRPVPMNSVKGAIGHTLGAAGGIEIALAVKSLEAATLAPTAGFTTPEEGAEGWVSGVPQELSGQYLLTTNSGFGGVNAALILKGGGA